MKPDRPRSQFSDRHPKWDFLNLPGDLIKVTLIETRGSAPRNESFMVIEATPPARQKGFFPAQGSIGGGLVEYQAILLARELFPHLSRARWLRAVRTVTLNPKFGQCCGGEVTLLYEYLGRYEKREYLRMMAMTPSPHFLVIPHKSHLPVRGQKKKNSSQTKFHFEIVSPSRLNLYIYGAGHVGRALIYHLRPLPFNIYWVDVNKKRFPVMKEEAGFSLIIDPEMKIIPPKVKPNSLHVVMTCDHVLDYRIVRTLVKKKVVFLGLIGSKTKARRFRQALKNDGYPSTEIGKLTCPIGAGMIQGKTPQQVALDTVIQLMGKSVFE